jgi:lysozyme
MSRPSRSAEASALLDAIAWAEGTFRDGSPDGYRVMFGGGLFKDMSRHPDTVIKGGRVSSAAAGRYQFMPGTWGGVSKKLGLKDFGPEAQDAAALELIRGRKVDPNRPLDINMMAALAPEWASFPTRSGGSYYPNQSVKKAADIQAFYNQRLAFHRGGSRAPATTASASPAPQMRAARTPAPTKEPPIAGLNQGQSTDFSRAAKEAIFRAAHSVAPIQMLGARAGMNAAKRKAGWAMPNILGSALRIFTGRP